MRLMRGLVGALLWVLSALLGLVGLLLCVTVVLLPVGIPLIGYARRLFGLSVRLMLPRAVSHPIHSGGKAADRGRGRAKAGFKRMRPDTKRLRKKAGHLVRSIRKRGAFI